MTLLTCIFLSRLQLDSLRGMPKRAKERAHALPRLKIDGTMLDLDDDIWLKLAIIFRKIVIAGASPISLRIVPIEVMVVNKTTVKHYPFVRLKSAGQYICRICRRAAIL